MEEIERSLREWFYRVKTTHQVWSLLKDHKVSINQRMRFGVIMEFRKKDLRG